MQNFVLNFPKYWFFLVEIQFPKFKCLQYSPIRDFCWLIYHDQFLSEKYTYTNYISYQKFRTFISRTLNFGQKITISDYFGQQKFPNFLCFSYNIGKLSKSAASILKKVELLSTPFWKSFYPNHFNKSTQILSTSIKKLNWN